MPNIALAAKVKKTHTFWMKVMGEGEDTQKLEKFFCKDFGRKVSSTLILQNWRKIFKIQLYSFKIYKLKKKKTVFKIIYEYIFFLTPFYQHLVF